MNDTSSHLDGYFSDEKIRQIAQSIGATEEETRNAISVAIPTLIGGYDRAADHPETADKITSQIQGIGGFGNDDIFSNLPQSRNTSLDDALGPGANELPGSKSPFGDSRSSPARGSSNAPSGRTSSQPQPQEEDGGLLDQIFGGKKKRVEDAIGKSSGLDLRKVGPLIAILAPIVLGALRSKAQANTQGKANSDDYRDALREAGRSVESRSSGSFIGRILDQDGDGDFDFSDILKLGMRFFMGSKR